MPKNALRKEVQVQAASGGTDVFATSQQAVEFLQKQHSFTPQLTARKEDKKGFTLTHRFVHNLDHSGNFGMIIFPSNFC